MLKLRRLRYLLVLLMLGNGSAMAASDGALGNIFLFNFDKTFKQTVDLCVARDPENGAAVAKAWGDWTSAHARELNELHSGRDQFSAWMKAQALDAKSALTMQQRALYFNGLDMFFQLQSVDGYRKMAKQRDAEVAEQCKQMATMFNDVSLTPMLNQALTEIRKTLADTKKQK